MAEAQPAELINLSKAQSFGFEVRYYYGTRYGEAESYTEITSSVTGCNMVYLARTPSIYGWQAEVNGVDFIDALEAGKTFKATRKFRQSGAWGSEEIFFEGIIMPGTVTSNHSTNTWQLVVVDVVEFLGRSQSPIYVIGKRNLATSASSTEDSASEARNVSDEGEFRGEPPLDGTRVVDGDMGSLWISQKAPTLTEETDDIPPSLTDQSILNELYPNPATGYDKAEHQWYEMARYSESDTAHNVYLMTRSGYVGVKEVRYQEIDDPDDTIDNGSNFAIITYSKDTYGKVWGDASSVPVYEYKNWRADQGSTGAVNASSFGFNLDGLGDYVAVMEVYDPNVPPSRDSAYWRTNIVISGSKTDITEDNTVNALDPSDNWADLNTTGSYSANQLVGCFVSRAHGGSSTQCMRYITANDATSGGVTRVYYSNWDTDKMQAGQNYKLRGYPYHIFEDFLPYPWKGSGLADPDETTSWRRSPDGDFANPSASVFVNDESPSPGLSGAYPDASGWAWVSLEPQPLGIITTQPLENGDSTVYVNGTDGLTATGSIFVGTSGPVAYTAKSNSTITLSSTWSGQTEPIGTVVYQSVGGVAVDDWPIKQIIAKRRDVPGYDNRPRVPQSWRIFGSDEESPRYPGETDWRNDWEPGGVAGFLAGNNTNTSITIETTLETALRLKHVLFAIKQMSDESYGRLNELEIYPDELTINASLSPGSTVSEFFKYLLLDMGIKDSADIQYADGSTESLGSFSTDGSQYITLLDDLARRTGQIVWAGPRYFRVRISYAIDWPTSTSEDNQMNLDTSNITSSTLVQLDDKSVSQVQVLIRDSNGNTETGIYPRTPRSTGQVFIEDKVFLMDINKADDLARWIYENKISEQASMEMVGACPWMRAGVHRVHLKWTFSSGFTGNGYLPFFITGVEHEVNHGTTEPGSRYWKTRATAKRMLHS